LAASSALSPASSNALEKNLKTYGDKQRELTKEQIEQLTLLRVKANEEADKKILESELSKLQKSSEIEALKIERLKLDGLTEIQLTEEKERRKLELIIATSEAQLKLLESSSDADQLAVEKLKTSISKAKDELENLNKKDQTDIFKLLGLDLDKDGKEAVKNALSELTSALGSILSDAIQIQIDDNQRLIDSLTTRIDANKKAIDEEQKAYEQGLASNYSMYKENELRLQAEKQKAAEENKKLQREQLALDSVAQFSGLVTSSANIFKALSPLGPVGVGLAVATIATMFGAFISSKARAAEQINKQEFEHGGGGELRGHRARGKRHSLGGIDVAGTDINIEDGEYFHVMNRKGSEKYMNVLNFLNENKPKLAAQELMKTAGIEISKNISVSPSGIVINAPEKETAKMHETIKKMLPEKRTYKKSYL